MGHHCPSDSAFCSPHCSHWDGTSLAIGLRLLFHTLSTLGWDVTGHLTPPSVPHIVCTGMGCHWPSDSTFCSLHCSHCDGMSLTMWSLLQSSLGQMTASCINILCKHSTYHRNCDDGDRDSLWNTRHRLHIDMVNRGEEFVLCDCCEDFQ
jgi:hypothetical protein